MDENTVEIVAVDQKLVTNGYCVIVLRFAAVVEFFLFQFFLNNLFLK